MEDSLYSDYEESPFEYMYEDTYGEDDIEAFFCFLYKKHRHQYWKTSKSEYIKISELKDKHLENIIKKFRKEKKDIPEELMVEYKKRFLILG